MEPQEKQPVAWGESEANLLLVDSARIAGAAALQECRRANPWPGFGIAPADVEQCGYRYDDRICWDTIAELEARLAATRSLLAQAAQAVAHIWGANLPYAGGFPGDQIDARDLFEHLTDTAEDFTGDAVSELRNLGLAPRLDAFADALGLPPLKRPRSSEIGARIREFKPLEPLS